MMLRFAATACLLLFALVPAAAQRLVVATSDPEVSIDSTFSGETITFFGSIEPDFGETIVPPGIYNIVIVVQGPTDNRVARLKEQVLGVWLNRQFSVFRAFPGYYWLLSSSPIAQFATPIDIEAQRLSFAALVRATGNSSDPKAEEFGGELVRLMQSRGLFGSNERGIQFQSDRLYTARIDLPAFVPNGNFLARTMLFRDGELVATTSQPFTVRTAGFDRFLVETARSQSLAYGLACVVLALATGWISGLAFRR